MTKSGYRRGNKFPKIYIHDNFLFKKTSTDRLGLRNFADSTYVNLDINAIYIKGSIGFRSVGDGYILGWGGSRTLQLAPFTQAEWDALEVANGMMGYNSDLDRIVSYLSDVMKVMEQTDRIELTFANAGATPTVTGMNDLAIGQAGATTITDFLGGHDMQIIRIRFTDGNSTVQHGVNIFLSGGVNKNFQANETLVLQLRTIAGNWYQIGGAI